MCRKQYKLHTDLGTQSQTATLFYSILSPMPLGYVSGGIEAFVEFLHLCHDEHQPKSKNDSYLFSPAIFEKGRGKENILYLRHVVLDFENGELQPETLPNLFPDLQMVVTNTYRHTHDKPRFRAVLFTDEPMTPETYSLIYNFVADKLVEAGYSVERTGKKLKPSKASNSRPSGLDWGEATPQVFSIFHAKHDVQTTASLLKRSKDGIHLIRQRGSKHQTCLSSQH